MKPKIFFKIFGCRTNIYDASLMQQQIKDFDEVFNEEKADAIVITSCTVTNGADTSVRSYINKWNKTKKIILAGCGAISKGDELFKNDKVHGVIGHSNKENINEFLKEKKRFFELGDLNSLDKTIVTKSEKSRAFIKIQEGCNFNCSYCIIPSVRGKSRSQKEDLLLQQIQSLSENGYSEFILTGTNIGSYGKDTSSSLAKLLKNISKIQGVKRIRMGSIEPVQIDDEFKELLNESWLEKHLHIALQHTNEEMLRIMRRRNSLQHDLNLFEEIASHGFALGTDYIVGHPGESEEIYQDGYKNLKRFPLTHIHAFTYSKREGTHAASLPNQIPNRVAKARLKNITNLIKTKNYDFRKQNQHTLKIFIEENKNGLFSGYDQFFNKILVQSKSDILHQWIDIKDYQVKEEYNFANFE